MDIIKYLLCARIFFLSLVLPIFLPGLITAQEINIRINLPPMNQVSVIDLFNVQLTNNCGKEWKGYLQGTVTEETRGLLFTSNSAVFILEPGFNTKPDNRHLKPMKTVYSNAELETFMLREGTVPPGTYTICVQIIDSVSGMELSKDCLQTEITLPDSPGKPTGDIHKDSLNIKRYEKNAAFNFGNNMDINSHSRTGRSHQR